MQLTTRAEPTVAHNAALEEVSDEGSYAFVGASSSARSAAGVVHAWAEARFAEKGQKHSDAWGMRIHEHLPKPGVSWVTYFRLDDATNFVDHGFASKAIELRRGAEPKLAAAIRTLRNEIMTKCRLAVEPHLCGLIVTPPNSPPQTWHKDSELPGNAATVQLRDDQTLTEFPYVWDAKENAHDRSAGVICYKDIKAGEFVAFDNTLPHRGPANPHPTENRYALFFSWETTDRALGQRATVIYWT